MKLKIIALGIALALAAAPGYARAVGMAGGAGHGGGVAHGGGFAHRGGFEHGRGFAHGHGFRDHRFGSRDHRFGSSFGGDFGDPFFDSYGYQPEYAEPDTVAPGDPYGVSPPVSSADPAQIVGPVDAHLVHPHRGPLAEAPGDRHEHVGQVVVIRPGHADEIVTVPAD